MRIKRGLIYPRNSMVNPYTAQGLPAIYKELSNSLEILIDNRARTGGTTYDLCGNQNGVLIYGDSSGSNDAAEQMWSNAEAGGIDCDGTNDAVNIGKYLQIFVDYNKAWTFEIWMQFDSYSAAANYQIAGIAKTYGAGWEEVRLLRIISGKPQYGMVVGVTLTPLAFDGYYCATSSAQTFTTGVKYHMVVTYDGSNTYQGYSFYKDSVKPSQGLLGTENYGAINQTMWQSGRLADMDTYVMARNANDSVNLPVNGQVFKIAMYSTNLSQLQITRLYNYESRFIR